MSSDSTLNMISLCKILLLSVRLSLRLTVDLSLGLSLLVLVCLSLHLPVSKSDSISVDYLLAACLSFSVCRLLVLFVCLSVSLSL